MKIPVVDSSCSGWRCSSPGRRSCRTPVSTSRASRTSRSPGPAILVANHRCYFDSSAMSMLIAKTGRTVRFLGKKEVFDAPVVGQLAAAMGGIRVDRGTGSDEPLKAAADALARRRDGGDDAAGHDPTRPGVLRSRAQGSLGRGPPRPDERRAGHPGRAVGHREGVAALGRGSRTCSTSPTRPPYGSASGSRWSSKHRSLDADTKRIMEAIRRPAAARSVRRPHADGGGAAPARTRRATTAIPTSRSNAAPAPTSRPSTVDRLADQIEVAAVAGVLLDHVDRIQRTLYCSRSRSRSSSAGTPPGSTRRARPHACQVTSASSSVSAGPTWSVRRRGRRPSSRSAPLVSRPAMPRRRIPAALRRSAMWRTRPVIVRSLGGTCRGASGGDRRCPSACPCETRVVAGTAASSELRRRSPHGVTRRPATDRVVARGGPRRRPSTTGRRASRSRTSRSVRVLGRRRTTGGAIEAELNALRAVPYASSTGSASTSCTSGRRSRTRCRS